MVAIVHANGPNHTHNRSRTFYSYSSVSRVENWSHNDPACPYYYLVRASVLSTISFMHDKYRFPLRTTLNPSFLGGGNPTYNLSNLRRGEILVDSKAIYEGGRST